MLNPPSPRQAVSPTSPLDEDELDVASGSAASRAAAPRVSPVVPEPSPVAPAPPPSMLPLPSLPDDNLLEEENEIDLGEDENGLVV